MSQNTKNLDTFKTTLQVEIYDALKKLFADKVDTVSPESIDITHPKEENHGDFSSSICLRISKILRQKPIDIAGAISQMSNVKSQKLKELGVEKIEIKAPGFINFWLTKEFLGSQLTEVLDEGDKFGENSVNPKTLEKFLKKLSNNIKIDQRGSSIKIMFEYCHPNTHKEFHIGHLRNITLAESLIRLLENQDIKIIRVNYQGDVGMHIAKALWALLQSGKRKAESGKLRTIEEKVKFLGKAYVAGNKAYEEDPKAKEEIIKINRKIYEKDPEILPLWKETRQWSLDYFEEMYKRVGSHYDRYYFESEVYESGKKIVEEYLKRGVFEKSEGAVIFPGEKYGLHNRVFITSEGFATYEAKDMGLGTLQFQEYHPDLIIHVVGPEQAGYFQVVFEALNKILPGSKNKELHYSYGWVRLKKGKMSSRTGNVVTGKWLLDEAKKKAGGLITEKDYSLEEIEEITEKVALAAVKYSMLKFSPQSDIVFDFAESVSLEGDCGPYLLYTYARTRSVLRRVNNLPSTIHHLSSKLNPEELALLRTIYKFPEVVFEAGVNFSPNIVCSFLFDLAQKYNLFYTKHSILTPKACLPAGRKAVEKVKEFRLALTAATSQIIKNGLKLLGIETLERM